MLFYDLNKPNFRLTHFLPQQFTYFFFTFTITNPQSLQFFRKTYLNFKLVVDTFAFDFPHIQRDLHKIPYHMTRIRHVFLVE